MADSAFTLAVFEHWDQPSVVQTYRLLLLRVYPWAGLSIMLKEVTVNKLSLNPNRLTFLLKIEEEDRFSGERRLL
jgi:hypothetical protein